MPNRLVLVCSFLLSLAGATAPSVASVITEEDAQFSRHWKSPTEIGFGYDTVLGTAEKQNAHEFIAFSALAQGAQVLSFEFTIPDDALLSDSYSGGGKVFWSSTPFRHAWDGEIAGSFQLDRWSPSATVDVLLSDEFDGSLYLGVYFTHGRDVRWQLSVPGNVVPAVENPESLNNLVLIEQAGAASPAPAPVPLPAGVWFMLGGMSLLGGLSLRNARGRHCVAA